MKLLRFFMLMLAIILISCSVNKKLSKVDIQKEAEVSDSVEYELIIFDPGFESWFISHCKPSWYHSQEYYELWNRQYVSAWNEKVISPRFSRFFESTIEYDPFTDYGLELNHKLFYYFMYVERALKINILPPGAGPQTIF